MAARQLYTSLRLVQLDHVVQSVAEQAYNELQSLAASLPTQPDEERKRALLQHLHATKQRLQRLHILLQWCHKAPAVAECKRVLEVAAGHIAALQHTREQLAFLHGELNYTMFPPYDISTARHVLRGDGYNALPTIIESELPSTSAGAKGHPTKQLSPEEVASQRESGIRALRRIDFLMRCKLVEEGLPDAVKLMSVNSGETKLTSASGQWTATLSLVPAPSDEVTLTKWKPPGAVVPARDDPEGTTAEATQPPAEGVDDEGGLEKMGQESIPKPPKKSEASLWRWRLLSFELLPAHPELSLTPGLRDWLQRNLEDRMWAAADVERLIALGLADLVVVPPPPLTRQQREARQRELDDTFTGRHGTGAQPTASGQPSSNALEVSLTASAGPGTSNSLAQQAAGKIPAWSKAPLAALHAVLHQSTGKIAVGVSMFEQGNALEGTRMWGKGRLRLDKPPSGSGARLRIWPHTPIVRYEDVESLKKVTVEDNSSSASTDNTMGLCVDVTVSVVGDVSCSIIPVLRNPESGTIVALYPWDEEGRINAERIVLCAAANAATLQLAGVKAALHQIASVLGDGMEEGWRVDTVILSPHDTPRVPALELCVHGEAWMSMHLRLVDGFPQLRLGPALLEDMQEESDSTSELYKSTLAKSQDALERRMVEKMSYIPSPGTKAASVMWVSDVARILADAWQFFATTKRKAALSNAALPYGLIPGVLPNLLFSTLGGVDPRAAALSGLEKTLVLGLPRFLSPREGIYSSYAPIARRGSLLSYLLIDCGCAVVDPTRFLSSRCTLLLCHATPRGVPTAIRLFLPVPDSFSTQGEPLGESKPAERWKTDGEGGRGKRKRALSPMDRKTAESTEESHRTNIDWSKLVRWALRTASVQQIQAQLETLKWKLEVTGGSFTIDAGSDVPTLILDADQMQKTEASQFLGRFVVRVPEIESLHGKTKDGLSFQFSLDAGDTAVDALVRTLCALKAQKCASRVTMAVQQAGEPLLQSVKVMRIHEDCMTLSSSSGNSLPVLINAKWSGQYLPSDEDGSHNIIRPVAIKCIVSSEPPLPQGLLDTLAQHLNGGNESAFLDSL